MVEDEMYLALALEDALSDAGYRVLSASRLSEAMQLVEHEHIDAAVLDINLHGETVYPLASKLDEQGVPFLFATAYARSSIPETFKGHAVLQKPYSMEGIVDAVASMCGQPH